ncbi:MAG: M42 family peptidase, partial [Clostridia bacterium]|nr:M42 family peptidase [Clostridia bacterium]
NDIKVQPKTTVAGGNDAGAMQVAGRGVRVAAVSLPCRYIHSPSSVLAESDVEETARLIRLLAERLPGDSL